MERSRFPAGGSGAVTSLPWEDILEAGVLFLQVDLPLLSHAVRWERAEVTVPAVRPPARLVVPAAGHLGGCVLAVTQNCSRAQATQGLGLFWNDDVTDSRGGRDCLTKYIFA